MTHADPATLAAAEELLADLATLDRWGRDEAGGFTRLAWSPQLRDAVEWCAERMREAGLRTEIDAAGNLIGAWDVGAGKALVVGSHLDTVTSGGRFDGALGVLAALDAVRRLRASGFEPARPIWIVAFMDEEGERFGSVMLGSRAFAGDAIEPELADRVDAQGVRLADAMRTWERDFARVDEARRVDEVHAYVELHNELGPVLERTGEEIGVATAIVGLVGLEAKLTGETNHAGTTPMPGRRDALVGAARALLRLRDEALAGEAFMATVGAIATAPGGANAVPGGCTFTIDLRATSEDGIATGEAAVARILADAAEAEGLTVATRELYRLTAAPLDPGLADVLADASERLGMRTRRMPSGAGHDGMLLAPHVPVGMLFVPSRGGVGHAPEEHTSDEDVAKGAAVLTEAIRRLAQ